MENNEINNVFAIPVNYTDSGKFANGMFETRNAVEAVIVVALLGYPLFAWFSFSIMAKIVIATVLVLPLAILALIGIDGDSFSQYLVRIFKYRRNKRTLHLRRVGYKYNEEDIKHSKKR